MYYNLLIKKQRRNFWQDCEKTINDSKMYDEELYSWNENGRYLTPSEVYAFWYSDGVLWDETTKYYQSLSKNVDDTFDYYKINDIEDF